MCTTEVHTNKSCHTYEFVMSHTQASVPEVGDGLLCNSEVHTNKSCHSYEFVMSHTQASVPEVGDGLAGKLVRNAFIGLCASGVLQCVAVCVAVCSSVKQCVAVCSSV